MRSLVVAFVLVLPAWTSGSAQITPDTVLTVEGIVVVVGSRAGVADPISLPVPVDVYGAEELTRVGQVDLGEVLGPHRTFVQLRPALVR